MRTLKREVSLLLWAVGAGLLSRVTYPLLPEKVATHFDFYGRPNGWMSPIGASLFGPLMILGLYGLLTFLGWLALTERGELRLDEANWYFYWIIRHLVLGFLFWTHLGVIGVNLLWFPSVFYVVSPGLAFLFIFLGFLIPRVKRNWVVGVRLPWTLVNDRAWREANRIFGWGLIISGIIAFLGIWSPWFLGVSIGFLLTSVLVVTVQSYLLYRRG